MHQHKSCMNEVKRCFGQGVGSNVVAAHLGIFEVQGFEKTRVEIGNEDMPGWADSGSEPGRDRATATADLKTSPTGTYTKSFEVANGTRVKGSRERWKSSRGFFACVVEDVRRFCQRTITAGCTVL